MAELVVINKTSTSITVDCQDLQFTDLSMYAYFRFRINSGAWVVRDSPTTSNTFSSLSSNTTYSFDAEAQLEADRDTSTWYAVGSTSGTTLQAPPSSPSITLISRTTTSITVTCSTVSNADEYRFYRDGSLVAILDEPSNVTITNLSPDTNYEIGVRACNSGGCSSKTTQNIKTLAENPRPNNWSWFTSKVQGGDFNLSANEWGGFTTRINDFREYKNLSRVTFGNFSSGQDFTASMFNLARNTIDSMNPSTSVPSSVSAGDDVTASGLNGLRNSLNSIS